MIPRIADLGRAIDRKWESHGRHIGDFPSICETHLERADLADFEASGFLEYLLSELDVDQGSDLTFGEPSIRLFQTEDFYIQALFWFDSTTAIHAHAFAGAFYALEGERICTTWSFREHRWLANQLCIGELTRDSTQLLQPGDIRRIEPASKGIHQIFHLGKPSVTLVVRTFSDKQLLPQPAYLPPGIACFEPENVLMQKRAQYLRGTLRSGHPSFLDYTQKFLDSFEEPAIAFMLLYSCLNDPSDVGREGVRIVRDAIARRYGLDALQAIEAASHEMARSAHIARVRSQFPERHLRIYLAWLMLVQSREEILRLISEHFDGASPTELVHRWSVEVGERTDVGLPFDDARSFLFRQLVADASISDLREAAIGKWGIEAVHATWSNVLEQADAIVRNRFFQPLLKGARYREERTRDLAA